MGTEAKIVFSATDQTKAAVASFQRGLTDLDKSASRLAGVNLGAGLVTALSGAGVTLFARNIINGLDALNDLKDATGASIENISALEDVAARTGTSFETMSSTLVKFNRVLAEAKPGNEIGNTLKKLGLDAEELKRIDPAEALRQTAVALNGFADDGDRARIVSLLFGKSVQEIAPYLKDLSEQGKLVAKVTTEQAQAAEDFNKALYNLEKNARDTARTLVSDLVPAINKVLEKGNKEGFMAIFGFDKEFFDKKKLADAAADVRMFDGYLKKMRADKEGGIGYFKDVDASIAATTIQLEAAKKKFRELDAAITGRGLPQASYSNEGRARPKPGIGGAPDADKPAKVSDLDRYIEQLEKAQVTVNELTETERAMYLLQTGELGKVNAAQAEYIMLLAKGIDLSKQKADERGPTIDQKVLEARNALEREVNSILAKRPTNVLRQEAQVEQELNKLRKAGTITLKEYQEALQAAFPEMRSFYEEMHALSREAASDIEATIGGNVRDVLKGNFDSILEDWENLLINMAAKAAQAEIARQLFGNYTNGGNLGGLIGTMFGGADGGSGPSLGGPTIGGGAEGGYVIPSMAGSGRMSAQSAPTIVNNYNVAAGVTRNEVITALQAVRKEASAETTQRLRAAGVA